MIWKARILLGTIWGGLSKTLPGPTTSGDRIAESLRWIVHPHRDDMFGHLEAALICRCAARHAAEAWDDTRLDAVAVKLHQHAEAVRRYAARPLRFNVERLLDGAEDAYPIPSEDLAADLRDLAPFIAACGKKMGGDGIEF